MAKVALLCPSNTLYMPYIDYYKEIFKRDKIDYEIIMWDRFNTESNSNKNIYKDSKVGHQRSYIDYLKYRKFLLKRIKNYEFDKLVVFGIQLGYFLRDFLIKEYKNRYILDIRDYNKIVKLFNIRKLINNSAFTVISSLEYKNWMPDTNKYIMSHNSQVNGLDSLKEVKEINKEKLNISYIGSIRDYDINISLIRSLKCNNNYDLYFHGQGSINEKIYAYLEKYNIENTFLSGRYNREKEDDLYEKSDFINVLIPNTDINSRTLLPNRLYRAAIWGKPILALDGTYLAGQVKKYKLGLVLKNFDGVEDIIEKFINDFRIEEYQKGRISFLKEVVQDNKYFKEKVIEFIKD